MSSRRSKRSDSSQNVLETSHSTIFSCTFQRAPKTVKYTLLELTVILNVPVLTFGQYQVHIRGTVLRSGKTLKNILIIYYMYIYVFINK